MKPVYTKTQLDPRRPWGNAVQSDHFRLLACLGWPHRKVWALLYEVEAAVGQFDWTHLVGSGSTLPITDRWACLGTIPGLLLAKMRADYRSV